MSKKKHGAARVGGGGTNLKWKKVKYTVKARTPVTGASAPATRKVEARDNINGWMLAGA